MPREIYYVDRKSLETRDAVEFELATAFDLAGIRAPKRLCIAQCQWVYRSAECSYTGTNYFNEADAAVATAALDVCGKRVSSCKARFGATAELPFGGFPGVGEYF
jgi:lambda family phage minor tail protein L